MSPHFNTSNTGAWKIGKLPKTVLRVKCCALFNNKELNGKWLSRLLVGGNCSSNKYGKLEGSKLLSWLKLHEDIIRTLAKVVEPNSIFSYQFAVQSQLVCLSIVIATSLMSSHSCYRPSTHDIVIIINLLFTEEYTQLIAIELRLDEAFGSAYWELNELIETHINRISILSVTSVRWTHSNLQMNNSIAHTIRPHSAHFIWATARLT